MSLFWKLTWLVSTLGAGSELEVAASVGANLLGQVCPVQTYYPEEGLTLPSPHYLKHPPQYFPPSPAYPLPKELEALEEATKSAQAPDRLTKPLSLQEALAIALENASPGQTPKSADAKQQDAAKVWIEEDFFAATVPGQTHRVKFMVKDLLKGISIPHVQTEVGPLKDADFKITATQIIELITSVIAPHTWEQRGGPGRLHYLPDERAIVVAHSHEVQEDVQQLLKALRRLREPKIRVDRVPDLSKDAMGPHCPTVFPHPNTCPQSSPRPVAVTVPKATYTSSVHFHLPVEIDERTRKTLKSVCFHVKRDSGAWTLQDTKDPQVISFDFSVPQDGDYWFHLVTVDKNDRRNPPDLEGEEPGLRVVVDTKEPKLAVHQFVGADGEPCLRCDMDDVNPDVSSLRVVYRGEKGHDWCAEIRGDEKGVCRLSKQMFGKKVHVTGKDLCGNVAIIDVDVKAPVTLGTERRSQTYRLVNAQVVDVAAALDEYFAKKLGPCKDEVRFVPDQISNVLLIEATSKYIDEAMKRVADFDVMPPQVMIQVLIAEVDAGCLWLPARGGGVGAMLRDLRKQGQLEIIKRPQVMALDGQAAVIHIGEDFPYAMSSAAIIAAVGKTDIGVTLTVIPKINHDGRVTMNVTPAITSQDPTPVNLGNGQYGTAFNIQRFDSSMTVADGETIVMGGVRPLNPKTDSKVQSVLTFLFDLPLIGAACRSCLDTRAKKELIVVLTPHIVRSRADADRIDAEETQRTDWIDGKIDAWSPAGNREKRAVGTCVPCYPRCHAGGESLPNGSQARIEKTGEMDSKSATTASFHSTPVRGTEVTSATAVPRSVALASAQQAANANPGSGLGNKIFTSKTRFSLPVEIDARTRTMLTNVCLYIKRDAAAWVKHDTKDAQVLSFSFDAPQDGEYWFHLVTVDKYLKLNPPDLDREPPASQVVVDTQAPKLTVQQLAAADGSARLKCDMADEHPDWSSLRFSTVSYNGHLELISVITEQHGIFRLPKEVFGRTVRVSAKDQCGNVGMCELDVSLPRLSISRPAFIPLSFPHVLAVLLRRGLPWQEYHAGPQVPTSALGVPVSDPQPKLTSPQR